MTQVSYKTYRQHVQASVDPGQQSSPGYRAGGEERGKPDCRSESRHLVAEVEPFNWEQAPTRLSEELTVSTRMSPAWARRGLNKQTQGKLVEMEDA